MLCRTLPQVELQAISFRTPSIVWTLLPTVPTRRVRVQHPRYCNGRLQIRATSGRMATLHTFGVRCPRLWALKNQRCTFIGAGSAESTLYTHAQKSNRPFLSRYGICLQRLHRSSSIITSPARFRPFAPYGMFSTTVKTSAVSRIFRARSRQTYRSSASSSHIITNRSNPRCRRLMVPTKR